MLSDMTRSPVRPGFALFCLCLLPATVGAAEIPGYGPWTFGMTPAEVEAVSQYGPYTKVQSTGGLETANGDFGGQKTPISFVFRPAGLYQIQIWLYTGSSFDEAVAALHRAYLDLGRSFGALGSTGGALAADLDPKQLAAKIGPDFADPKESLLPRLRAGGTVQVSTITFRIAPISLPTAGRDVHADLIRSPELGSYYVFEYYRAPLLGK
jgi:hypothetical protein